MNVGQRIREAREDLGMQQTVLARRVGVAPNTIGRYESGERVPPVAMLEKIAKELRTEPAEFLRGPGAAGEAADLRRLRQALWLQLRELDVAGAVRTEAPRSRLGEVLEVLEELDNVEERMLELAPTPLATITERTNGEALIIYHDGATPEVRARLRREYPGAEEIEAQEPVFAYS